MKEFYLNALMCNEIHRIVFELFMQIFVYINEVSVQQVKSYQVKQFEQGECR